MADDEQQEPPDTDNTESDAEQQDEPQKVVRPHGRPPKQTNTNGSNGYTRQAGTYVPDARTFKQIMTAVDADGQFNETSTDEYKVGLKIQVTHKARRNFIKNQAISLLCSGFSPQQVADLLDVPPSTISTWRANLTPETLAIVEVAEIKVVTSRIAQSVSTCLASVERVALAMSEKSYVQKQDPEKMVKAFEALTKFSMGLVEAHQRTQMARRQIASEQGLTPTDPDATQFAKDETTTEQ
jgi:hypothetical protein